MKEFVLLYHFFVFRQDIEFAREQGERALYVKEKPQYYCCGDSVFIMFTPSRGKEEVTFYRFLFIL